MLIFVGLGNPGSGYARNRHNVGFMAVDGIVRRHGFSSYRARFHGEVAEGTLGGEKVLVLKPMTYMNLSGRAVQAAMAFYKVPPGDVVVFHDELDLAAGRLRTKRGGGHGGHNGLRDIHAHVGPDYRRVRIGIGHPGDKDRVTGHVLKDFAKADEDWLGKLLDAIADNAEFLARGEDGRFMNAVSLVMNPPRPNKPKPEGPGDKEENKDNGV
ncbi:MAG: aminoacyl-tRNA hydrolase [Hyphomicrobiales bacterium]|nr:aminoacyl-tRNA hydrolase [Hyphomicrobiales bacterium]